MTPEHEKTGKKRRLLLAVGLSSLVAVAAGANVIVVGKNPLAASLPDFGQWLSGVAGALAFIWLIVSYFQQGEELELQRKELAATREQLALQKVEMARLADEAAKQAKSIEATEQHARRDTFMGIQELLERQLHEQARIICLRIFERYQNGLVLPREGGGSYVFSLTISPNPARPAFELDRQLVIWMATAQWQDIRSSLMKSIFGDEHMVSAVRAYRQLADFLTSEAQAIGLEQILSDSDSLRLNRRLAASNFDLK
ncbi:MAG: hypothetical protein Q8N31_08065 [Reyranella sp.]|nr:hypothetical protein [Reyranella sp.]MDP3159954.1 hypothetical protein [Reyranella sp.]